MGSARSLCNIAVGQVSALKMVSKFKDYTEEEHTAMLGTVVQVQETLQALLKEVIKMEHEVFVLKDDLHNADRLLKIKE